MLAATRSHLFVVRAGFIPAQGGDKRRPYTGQVTNAHTIMNSAPVSLALTTKGRDQLTPFALLPGPGNPLRLCQASLEPTCSNPQEITGDRQIEHRGSEHAAQRPEEPNRD